MTDPKGSPDFGEPWEVPQGWDARTRDGALALTGPGPRAIARSVACVNALAGIADPEAWVREARDALRESLAAMQANIAYATRKDEHALARAIPLAQAALAGAPALAGTPPLNVPAPSRAHTRAEPYGWVQTPAPPPTPDLAAQLREARELLREVLRTGGAGRFALHDRIRAFLAPGGHTP